MKDRSDATSKSNSINMLNFFLSVFFLSIQISPYLSFISSSFYGHDQFSTISRDKSNGNKQ